jgi:hypothetical protein
VWSPFAALISAIYFFKIGAIKREHFYVLFCGEGGLLAVIPPGGKPKENDRSPCFDFLLSYLGKTSFPAPANKKSR